MGHNKGMYLYVHVPFCQSRCIYCDFYVVLDKYGGREGFVDGLIREMALRFQPGMGTLEGIYVGGGTPSLLSADDYTRFFDALRQYWRVADHAEITLEANPRGMTDHPEAYLAAGFNRVSVGVQSLNDSELKKLSRIHKAVEAAVFVRRLEDAGFDNISVDLMYGIPEQTPESWRRTLAWTADLGVQHVSMYGLKVEKGTPLETLTTAKAYTLPDEDAHVEMFFEGIDFLERVGFRHYEVSNLALPGYESRHNLNYWDTGEFWALGPAAHGYINARRYENVRDLAKWLDNPLDGHVHECSDQERLENAIIFGLRKTDGIDVKALGKRHGFEFMERYGWILAKYPDHLLMDRGRLRLDRRAIPVSNAILAEFIEC